MKNRINNTIPSFLIFTWVLDGIRQYSHNTLLSWSRLAIITNTMKIDNGSLRRYTNVGIVYIHNNNLTNNSYVKSLHFKIQTFVIVKKNGEIIIVFFIYKLFEWIIDLTFTFFSLLKLCPATAASTHRRTVWKLVWKFCKK